MDIASRYLELLKKSLLDELYLENEARLLYLVLCMLSGMPVREEAIRDIGKHHPDILERLREARQEGAIAFNWTIRRPDGSSENVNLRNVMEFYHTMMGRKRLDNIQTLLDEIVAKNVPGDLIETGVWRGGGTIFMRGYLAAYGISDRAVFVADSFQGLPVPTKPQDAGADFSAGVHPILAISLEEVRELFHRYDLLDAQVRFLPGWFKDTLPAAPIDKLALLRLDGDLYESTWDALEALYPKLSPGGFVIVDDYFDFKPCKTAIDEFRAKVGDSAKLEKIDWASVYWRKPAPATPG